MRMLTTPTTITPEILALCQRLGCTSVPEFVPVETHLEAEESDCFIDVEKQRNDHGGDSVIGWQIWEWPGVMIEAEFHAVWRSPRGRLVDVSYKPDGERQILFVPDPVRTYTGRKLDNVRAPVWNNPLVHEFIAVNEEFQQEIINRHGADYVGNVEITGRLEELYNRKAELQWQIPAAFARRLREM